MLTVEYGFNITQLKQDARSYYETYAPQHHQICTTGTSPNESPLQGSGSLVKDWKDATTKVRFENPLTETEFVHFLDVFKGHYVEEVYAQLSNRWNIGRLRFMFLRPKTCLSWHRDDTQRVHVPIHTHTKKTALILEDQVLRMPANGHAYLVDTRLAHTVFNGWDEVRIHLVGTVLS